MTGRTGKETRPAGRGGEPPKTLCDHVALGGFVTVPPPPWLLGVLASAGSPLPCCPPWPSRAAPRHSGASVPFLRSHRRPSARPSCGHHVVSRRSGPGWLLCDAGRVSSPLWVSASSSFNEASWTQRPLMLGASKQRVPALVPPRQQSGLRPVRPEVHVPRSFP